MGGDSSDVAAGALVWCVGRSDGERVDDGLWCGGGGGGGGGGGHEGNNDEAAGRVGGSREAPRLISGFVGRGGSAAATTCQLLTAAAIYGAAGGTVFEVESAAFEAGVEVGRGSWWNLDRRWGWFTKWRDITVWWVSDGIYLSGISLLLGALYLIKN